MDGKYAIVNKFQCCGKSLLTVLIKGKAACVMIEFEYNKIIDTEQKM